MAVDVLSEIPTSEFDQIVRRVCAKYNGVDADDVWQEMMLRLLKKVRGNKDFFQSREHVLGRACIEANSVAFAICKSKQAERVNFTDPTALPEPAHWDESAEIVRLKERLADRDALLALLASADPGVRAVFPRLWDGATQEEVAAELGLGRSAVYRHWRLALDVLKRALERTDWPRVVS